ncbi:MAG TPA: hypothetical protein VEY93_00545, partial [Longimicrobium sp.]|nr:hypothetical protein [Longimicrobium sp.]
MPKPRVYVETTIPSFYHDPRRAPGIVKMLRWTRLWWHSAADRYELVTSAYVRNELAAGNLEIARDRLALIGEVPLIEPGPRVPLIVQA